MSGPESAKKTPAQRFLDLLESEKGLHYIAYTADRSESHLVTLYEKKRTHLGTSITSPSVIDEEVRSFSQDILEALQLDSGKILLSVAWTSDEQKRNHVMFPHVLGMDVTKVRNSKFRNLFFSLFRKFAHVFLFSKIRIRPVRHARGFYAGSRIRPAFGLHTRVPLFGFLCDDNPRVCTYIRM